MNKITYNQFQSLYTLDDNRKIILDFFYNTINTYPEDASFQYNYDESYNIKSFNLDNLLIKKSNELLDITLITNLDCNMHCIYCYENNACLNIKNKQHSTKVNDIINFISSEFKNNSFKGINVTILGGEPLLEKNISFLNKFFKEINLLTPSSKFCLVTNGLNVNRYINEITAWGINEIQITLDGTEKIHNDRRVALDKNINGFKEIEDGISALLQHNINVFLRINVDKNNVNDIINLAKFILAKDWLNKKLVPYIYPVTTSGNKNYILNDTEVSIFKQVLYELKKEPFEIRNLFRFDFHGIDYIDSLINAQLPSIRTRFCGLSKGQYVISFDGTILNCWWGLDDETFKIGKMDTTGYYINHSKVDKFSKRNTLEISKCKSCKFKYICGSGCTYKEYLNNGTIDKGNCSEFDLLIKEYLNYVL